MQWLHVLVVCAVPLMAACAATPDPSTPTASPSDALGKQLQGNGQGPDVNLNPPGATGPCEFKVANECFATAEAACKSIGCELATCEQLESYPAQVQCKK